jgi:D-proline reductase (dithiol) PrdB
VRSDRPFTFGGASAVNIPGDYRVIPRDTNANDLVMSHISTNYDRSGFQKDWNVVFPLDRLRELAERGVIGSVADHHYSFMGATAPHLMETAARTLAGLLKGDGVTAATGPCLTELHARRWRACTLHRRRGCPHHTDQLETRAY